MNDRLFEMLAQAQGQPSRALRAVQSAGQAGEDILGGYLKGKEIGDSFQKQKAERQTLSEALGGQDLESGLMNLTGVTGAAQHPNVMAAIDLLKAQKEKNTPVPRIQQGQFQYNGMLTRFDPVAGSYEALAPEGWKTIGTPSSLPSKGSSTIPKSSIPSGGEISPRVPPTIPTPEADKLADLNAMKEALGVAKKNFSPDFVGPVSARKLGLSQTVNLPSIGLGATGQGALFTQSVQDIKDRLLRARSGAQINEQEYQRLVSLVPDQYKSVPDFLAKLGRFDEVLNSTISSKRQELMRAGYRGASTLPNNQPNVSQQQSDPLGLFK